MSIGAKRAQSSLLQQTVSSFWFWAGLIVVARIATLLLSEANLGPDESQYWFWSQEPAFGYFSKPPVIAWSIGATTALFGNEEWAVRLAAPLYHLGAAAFLYLAASALFDRRLGFWVGLTWLTLPAVNLSSFVIATDAPLLFFWSAALFILVRILNRRDESFASYLGLGACIGLGLLSKYAMIYFVVAFSLCAAFLPAVRAALNLRKLLAAVALIVALIIPNVLWNAAHDFQTVSHTAANANWSAQRPDPLALASFWGGQLIVFGPILFIALLALVWMHFASRTIRPAADWRVRFLLIFALTPIVIVSAQAFVSRAHANWAVAAYPTATIAVVYWLTTIDEMRIVRASLGLHALAAVVFILAITNFAFVDRIGLSSALREIRGWEQQAADVAKAIEARQDRYDALLIDDRALMGAMLYYERDRDFEIAAIDVNRSTEHHYEAFMAFDPRRHRRVLFATSRPDDAHVNYRFRQIKPVGETSAALGPDTARAFRLYDISEYFGRDAPQD
ncbi:MAG: glycosyltransferase family 39 protein [Pseudomonadota bacterium]